MAAEDIERFEFVDCVAFSSSISAQVVDLRLVDGAFAKHVVLFKCQLQNFSSLIMTVAELSDAVVGWHFKTLPTGPADTIDIRIDGFDPEHSGVECACRMQIFCEAIDRYDVWPLFVVDIVCRSILEGLTRACRSLVQPHAEGQRHFEGSSLRNRYGEAVRELRHFI